MQARTARIMRFSLPHNPRTDARACRPIIPDPRRPVHLVAAMDHASRAVLTQRQVGGAPEEVPAFAHCWRPWIWPA